MAEWQTEIRIDEASAASTMIYESIVINELDMTRMEMSDNPLVAYIFIYQDVFVVVASIQGDEALLQTIVTSMIATR